MKNLEVAIPCDRKLSPIVTRFCPKTGEGGGGTQCKHQQTNRPALFGYQRQSSPCSSQSPLPKPSSPPELATPAPALTPNPPASRLTRCATRPTTPLTARTSLPPSSSSPRWPRRTPPTRTSSTTSPPPRTPSDQNSAATETYKKAIAADPKFFEPHLALALLLGREGKTKEAHAELDIAVTLDAPDPALKARAYRTLARIDQRTSPAAASSSLLDALKISPETADDILLGAELAEASNDFTSAEASYRRLLKLTPNDPAATAALAHIFLRQNKPEAAEPILLAALAAHPDGPAAMPLNAQLAAVRMASNDPSKSVQALPQLIQLHKDEPNNASITRILARLYSRTGDYAQADQLFSQLLAALPASAEPDPTLLDDKADALIHLKRSPEAETLLKRALANQSAFPSKADLATAAGTSPSPPPRTMTRKRHCKRSP